MSLWQDARRSFADLVDIVLMIPGALTGWEWTISRFESQDRLHPPLPGAIVFTGSSSITFWKTLEEDMAPLRAINRGFGGSKIDQVAGFADRIVIPYGPRAVVLFAGTNDIAGPKPGTAEQVFQGYLAFVEKVRAALPEVPVYYISITPAPSRWKLWPIARAANELIRAYASAHRHLHFIDLTDAILGPSGEPDRSLFRIDKLHPNERGYARWTAVVKPVLQADLSSIGQVSAPAEDRRGARRVSAWTCAWGDAPCWHSAAPSGLGGFGPQIAQVGQWTPVVETESYGLQAHRRGLGTARANSSSAIRFRKVKNVSRTEVWYAVADHGKAAAIARRVAGAGDQRHT